MLSFTPTLVALLSIGSLALGQTCTGNGSICPGGQDGVSPTYLQCDSWSHRFVSMPCATGQVCYANPTKPGFAMCGLPGTGGTGTCTGNVAKCVSPSGQGSAYLQCNQWSHQFQTVQCPAGLKCFNNASNTGVFCN
ncbi:hypothetical protein GGI01_001637 [Coemansia sp. RSA 376]|nr:hypothetical protein H4S04_003489 [Coemansia sp. S16]KAJ2058788.1 hypothetical protein GGH13_007071 [Coemansia sp. S155-1]KAJ2262295.1 hypothetical protein GGI01_001637 [Coemansia sp. RSA 376]KAJ2346710.1 hypothetical protein GGH92_003479 [Coemansia sp. RSA 2673]KAJ2460618.1 hypothetical protein GGI03_005235 [Coemansia sp. RSA 2337]